MSSRKKTYEAHIDEEVHLYGLLHQFAFLAGKIKDRRMSRRSLRRRSGTARSPMTSLTPGTFPAVTWCSATKADLAGMKARELCELDAFYVECEDDEPEPGAAARRNTI